MNRRLLMRVNGNNSLLMARLVAVFERCSFAACDAIIVVPPGASLERPAIGPHLLAACAQDEGFRVGVVYANMLYAAVTGLPVYSKYCNFSSELWGERVFSEAAYGTPLRGRASLEKQRSPFVFEDCEAKLSWKQLRAMATLAVRWADQISIVLAKFSPRVIGFTSMFQQNAPDAIHICGCCKWRFQFGGCFRLMFDTLLMPI